MHTGCKKRDENVYFCWVEIPHTSILNFIREGRYFKQVYHLGDERASGNREWEAGWRICISNMYYHYKSLFFFLFHRICLICCFLLLIFLTLLFVYFSRYNTVNELVWVRNENVNFLLSKSSFSCDEDDRHTCKNSKYCIAPSLLLKYKENWRGTLRVHRLMRSIISHLRKIL